MNVTREQMLAVIGRLLPTLQERVPVSRLALFGSVARDTAGPDSDVDVLVEFDRPVTARQFFEVQFALEDALGRRVDLVTRKGLRPELRESIERDLVDAGA
jgi:predicted nucleotidyltransferase